jgi:hypothetical protein
MTETRTEFRLVGLPPDRSIESEIRALNSLIIMPGPKPDLTRFHGSG